LRSLKRFAYLLLFISIVPVVIFVVRSEIGKETIEVKSKKRQEIENFVLKSSGKNSWTLTAPRAVFLDESRILLLNAKVLTTVREKPVEITAKRAIYEKQKERVKMEKVKVKGKSFWGMSEKGVYLSKRRIFVGKNGCYLTIEGKGKVRGKSCKINFNSGIISVKGKVFSNLRG